MKRMHLLFLSLLCLISIAWAWKNPKVDDYMRKGYDAWQAGNLTEAMNAYETVLTLKPRNTDALNYLGVLYEEAGMPQKAQEKYLTAIKLDRGYLPAYSNLAIMYWNQGDTEKSIYYFKKRIQYSKSHDPWTMKAQNSLMNIQTHRSVSRQMEIEQAMNLDKQRLGLIDQTLDQIDQPPAQERHQETLDIFAEAQVIFSQGNEFAQQQRYQEAVEAYDRALKITPGDKQMIKARISAYMKLKQQSNNWN